MTSFIPNDRFIVFLPINLGIVADMMTNKFCFGLEDTFDQNWSKSLEQILKK